MATVRLQPIGNFKMATVQFFSSSSSSCHDHPHTHLTQLRPDQQRSARGCGGVRQDHIPPLLCPMGTLQHTNLQLRGRFFILLLRGAFLKKYSGVRSKAEDLAKGHPYYSGRRLCDEPVTRPEESYRI